MKERFVEDATRWESGQLSLDELEGRYPSEDVRGLAELSTRLAAIAEVPTPDPGPSWDILRYQLPIRLRGRGRLRSRIRRPLVAAATAMAALMGGTSVAYAVGVQPVRHGVDRIFRDITNLFIGDHGNQGNIDNGDQDNVDQRDQGNVVPGGRTGQGENSNVNQGSQGHQGQLNQGHQGNKGGQDGEGNGDNHNQGSDDNQANVDSGDGGNANQSGSNQP
jgi:hypothetical protein